jgi:hypothetical protein
MIIARRWKIWIRIIALIMRLLRKSELVQNLVSDLLTRRSAALPRTLRLASLMPLRRILIMLRRDMLPKMRILIAI